MFSLVFDCGSHAVYKSRLRHARADVNILRAGAAGDRDVDFIGTARTPHGFVVAAPGRALGRRESFREMRDRQPREFPQALLDVALGEPGFMQALRVIDAEQEQHAVAAAVHRRHVGRDLAQNFLGADTFAGPAYLGVGFGKDGNWSLYMLLGAP
jgi:hypothetical protein